MKKLIFIAALFSALSIYAKPAKKIKIGIAKIVQHVALDDIERGVIAKCKWRRWNCGSNCKSV